MKIYNLRKGFTLAEVLITLGIIGVVAAMTMPSLIASHKEKETVARLKKAYSVLSQAMIYAVNEYGTADNWGTYQYDETEDTMNRYNPTNLIKQVQKAKDCGFRSEGCFQTNYKMLNGTAERDFENDNARYYKLALADGTTFAFNGYNADSDICTGERNTCGEIWVDINGKARPNTVARDIFIFLYTRDKILPYGYDKTDVPLSSTTCKKNSNGYPCTAWVLANENLEYLHCNDLSWKGKTKCK